jgi:hypothetical protein
MSAVIATLARQAALKAIKLDLTKRGAKVRDFDLRTLLSLADAYAEVHRKELAAQAIETINGCPKLRKMYEREIAKAKVATASELLTKLNNSAQRKVHCSNSGILERNSGAKVGYARVSTDGQTLDAQ